MNEWPAAIWASISAMTAALVLSFIVVLGSLARESAAIQQQDDDAVAIVKEYRKISRYEGTTGLYPQDVISAIAESKGMPTVAVDLVAGASDTFELWDSERYKDHKNEFSPTYLTELTGTFPIDARFDATLFKDENGAIAEIRFRRP
ncbi:hypothetical protein [Cohnella fermenti]|uniref:Uncharacterized protein n=1 Tax=Cohnella fermenti TaxID=2565925 RepID=A0A4S4BLP9_9BACL|nr:hypothetical protein [Cohnella fermenti]THF74761.1 hypothetical protein E6C55_24445 [Cohnella fermenti]